jgi:tetratricopeptide (TPR) repeat protein
MATKHKSANSPQTSDTFEHDELLALARFDIEKGDLSEALWKLKQVTAAETAPAEAFSMCGRLYAQLSLFDRAQKMFQKYLELEPKAVTETFQLGMVHFDAGRSAEALKIWDELLKNYPAHPPALFYRALSLAQEANILQARQALDVLLKSAPADNLYFGRGKELLQSLDSFQQSAKPAANTAPGADARAALAKDAYKTEH